MDGGLEGHLSLPLAHEGPRLSREHPRGLLGRLLHHLDLRRGLHEELEDEAEVLDAASKARVVALNDEVHELNQTVLLFPQLRD